MSEYDWNAAHEALESLDDFARMDVGVNPYGPYAVLRDLLTKAKGWQEDALRYRRVRENAWRAPGTYQGWKHLCAVSFDAAVDADLSGDTYTITEAGKAALEGKK